MVGRLLDKFAVVGFVVLFIAPLFLVRSRRSPLLSILFHLASMGLARDKSFEGGFSTKTCILQRFFLFGSLSCMVESPAHYSRSKSLLP